MCDLPNTATLVLPGIDQSLRLHREYSQAVDDEQGMRLIGCTFHERELAEVGVADTPGAYVASRWVTEWER
jgi:hypothetical protein